jgi:hypothetical protein
MGKGERNRQQAARERIAAQQAAARRAEARRRIFIAGGSVLAVIAIVVALVIIKTTSKTPAGSTAGGPVATASLDAQVAYDIAHVPASVLNQVGAGPSGSNAVDPLQAAVKKVSLLKSDGKPEMLFIGAEWCPYCGAERWVMAVALSRFGTFTGLHLIHSDSDDVYSNTMTLSFYKSTYTSKYLTFVPVESENTSKGALQNPTSEQTALMQTYDNPPYLPSSDQGELPFPFIDIGNQWIDDGAQYVPSILGTSPNEDPTHYGLTWAQIANDLKNPNSLVGQSILGSANYMTAAICKVTGGQPGSVCTSPGVKAITHI